MTSPIPNRRRPPSSGVVMNKQLLPVLALACLVMTGAAPVKHPTVLLVPLDTIRAD